MMTSGKIPNSTVFTSHKTNFALYLCSNFKAPYHHLSLAGLWWGAVAFHCWQRVRGVAHPRQFSSPLHSGHIETNSYTHSLSCKALSEKIVINSGIVRLILSHLRYIYIYTALAACTVSIHPCLPTFMSQHNKLYAVTDHMVWQSP